VTAVASVAVDLDRLLHLRLVVARFGEMDVARWWNSKGMLGRYGAVVLKRGFPATHYFVQARVVFAVARSRSQELFNPPGCMTLWNLPGEVEEAFEDCWQNWLDESDRWVSVFESLASMECGDLLEIMTSFGLLSVVPRDAIAKLRRSAEGRSVALPGTYAVSDEVVTLLAAGFARGEVGNPVIPYARMEG
jgi:hypothetical protein